MPETGCILSKSHPLDGKYEVGKLLGCGAFAKVFHARDHATGQSVAIKVINKRKILGSSLMSNIKREISIMRQIRHPHIVKLYEVLATKTKIYFVMEFVKGGELFARVSKRGRFSEDLSRKYFHQLISALKYCHSRGIFHRDLKPENLLVDESGDLKVSDFGLSAFSDQIRPDGLLHTLCGTPAYVAPEILAKRGYNGTKVDVWSCGVVLFVLCAGFLPFNDPNLMAMYKKIYKGEYRCPKWMSSDLKHLLTRILDTNPDTRINIDEITRDPWLLKGGGYYKNQLKSYNYEEEEEEEDCSSIKDKEGNTLDILSSSTSELNAFDIISFSSGLNLSGLFDQSMAAGSAGDRMVLTESSPEEIIEKVEKIGKGVNAKMKKRMKVKWGVDLRGQNGNFVIGVEVYRLTDNMVVVEIKQPSTVTAAATTAGEYELWREKIKASLGLTP